MRIFSAGIDIGTTHTKAVILSLEGKIMAQYRIAYKPRQAEPGFHELDANEVLDAVILVLKKCFSGEWKERIASVCFSAAMHGLMVVDENGDPLTGVITWADTRSKNESLELRNKDISAALYAATGTPVHPMSPLCKLLWLKKNEPAIFYKAAKFISFKEYVFFKLTGLYLIDHSIASATGLFDMHELKWNEQALSVAGIDEQQLSGIYPVTHSVTIILDQYRELIGIDEPVPFILGGSDGAMANIGSGAVFPGIASLTIGTSAAIRMFVPHAITDDKQRLFCYAFDKSSYICGGPLNNGGVVAKWFTENILHKKFESEESYGAFTEGAFDSDDVSGLLFIPHLMGERAIHWDAFAKAAFIGLTPAHTDKQMLLSIFEGICFALYQILIAMEESGMPVTRIDAGGGFTASAGWLQLVADVLDKEVTVLDDADVSAKGAAIFGFQTMGMISEFSEIPSVKRDTAIYYPRKEKHSIYRDYFAIYTSLYPLLKESFFKLDRLVQIKNSKLKIQK